MLVTEPDLHRTVGPGGAEAVGGKNPVRTHSVSSAGLVLTRGHQPVPAVLGRGAVTEDHWPLDQEPRTQPRSRHHGEETRDQVCDDIKETG